MPAGFEGERLDRVLAQLFTQYSRAQLQRWTRDGRVMVDAAPCLDTRRRIFGGERLTLTPQTQTREWADAQALPLSVLHRDDDLIILDKAAGMVVHPGAGNPSGTLVNALLHLEPGLAALPRAGLVHRLDKDTTGLLVVATSLEAHTTLTRMMSERRISRRYEAVVHGQPPPGGTVDAPLGRHPRLRTRMAVVSSGREARTHFRRLACFPRHAHLALELDTGRTHQIRVHLAHIGHPLVGDRSYGGIRPASADLAPEAALALEEFPRQALHARHLAFTHPVSGEDMLFSSELPADFRVLLAALAGGAA